MGYILLVLGNKRLLFLTETFFHIFHFILIFFGLKFYGLVGIGIAYAVLYIAHIVAMRSVANYLTNFSWVSTYRKSLIFATISTSGCFVILKSFSTKIGLLLGFILLLIVCIFSLSRLLEISKTDENKKLSLFKSVFMKIVSRLYF